MKDNTLTLLCGSLTWTLTSPVITASGTGGDEEYAIALEGRDETGDILMIEITTGDMEKVLALEKMFPN